MAAAAVNIANNGRTRSCSPSMTRSAPGTISGTAAAIRRLTSAAGRSVRATPSQSWRRCARGPRRPRRSRSNYAEQGGPAVASLRRSHRPGAGAWTRTAQCGLDLRPPGPYRIAVTDHPAARVSRRPHATRTVRRLRRALEITASATAVPSTISGVPQSAWAAAWWPESGITGVPTASAVAGPRARRGVEARVDRRQQARVFGRIKSSQPGGAAARGRDRESACLQYGASPRQSTPPSPSRKVGGRRGC